MDPFTLKDLFEIGFTFWPPLSLQFFELMALGINAILDALGIDFKVIAF